MRGFGSLGQGASTTPINYDIWTGGPIYIPPGTTPIPMVLPATYHAPAPRPKPAPVASTFNPNDPQWNDPVYTPVVYDANIDPTIIGEPIAPTKFPWWILLLGVGYIKMTEKKGRGRKKR